MTTTLRGNGPPLFRQAAFIASAATLESLPPLGPMEIAFIGRSNVGKSSLINALTGTHGLARVSKTPGATRALNFFALGLEQQAWLIDMPGYGYAQRSKTEVALWQNLIKIYLRGRTTLRRVYVLVDSRHGAKDTDQEFLKLLDETAVSSQILLTKADALGEKDRAASLAAMRGVLRKHPAALPEPWLVSAESGEGIPELQQDILSLLG